MNKSVDCHLLGVLNLWQFLQLSGLSEIERKTKAAEIWFQQLPEQLEKC